MEQKIDQMTGNVTRVEGLSLITLRMVDKCKVEGTKEGGGTQQNIDC